MTPRLRNLRTRVLAGAALFTVTSGTVYALGLIALSGGAV